MLGDQAPASMLQTFASSPSPIMQQAVPGQPPTPTAPGLSQGRTVLIPWARGFKIADNQSPIPQDRVFYSFNAFQDLNYAVNRSLNSPITDMNAYRQMLGIEKTFLQGDASLGLRLPINTLWTNSTDGAFKDNSTAVGNLSLFGKYVLYRNPMTGNLLSGGLAITLPSGPTSFAGSSTTVGLRDVQFQPFLGYLFRKGDWFVQGFSAIDVPTDSRDVTLWYNDVALGYYLYRSANPSAFLSAIVPTVELHLSDPLNHRGALRPNDPFGTPDVLDLTFGTSIVLRKRIVASFGGSFPVTGPRPFSIEAMALLNIYYGRTSQAQPTPLPPMLAQ